MAASLRRAAAGSGRDGEDGGTEGFAYKRPQTGSEPTDENKSYSSSCQTSARAPIDPSHPIGNRGSSNCGRGMEEKRIHTLHFYRGIKGRVGGLSFG